jgi:hypothetical protein
MQGFGPTSIGAFYITKRVDVDVMERRIDRQSAVPEGQQIIE